MPKAFDTTGCGIDAPDAIESFRFVSNCVIDLPVPPILESDDLDLFIPTDFAQGSLELPCPDVILDAEADTLPNDPEGEAAEATVEVEEIPVPGSLGCAHSFLFKFGVPQGPRGLRGSDGRPGSRGETGSRGPTGPCAEIDISADVNIVGSNEEGNVDVTPGGSACSPSFHFLFTLPRGERGSTGPEGPQGPQGVPGDDGITTVITDCADPAGSATLGTFVKSVNLSSNGFNRIYLDVVSAPIVANLSECGVISLEEGDLIFERQNTLLDDICRRCCDYICDDTPSSSSSPPGCLDCVYSIEIGDTTYEMSSLVAGLVWVDGGGSVFLFAPGENVCQGEWRVEYQVGGEPVCTWRGDWDGNSCLVFYLDGPTSDTCPNLTAYVCCSQPVSFNCACENGVPSPVYFRPVATLGIDCTCTFPEASYELVEVDPGVWGWSGTLCDKPFSIIIYCVSGGPSLTTDLWYEISWDMNGGGAIEGFVTENYVEPPTCIPFFTETRTSLVGLPCDMGMGTFQWYLHE